jgi:hypothetical protein
MYNVRAVVLCALDGQVEWLQQTRNHVFTAARYSGRHEGLEGTAQQCIIFLNEVPGVLHAELGVRTRDDNLVVDTTVCDPRRCTSHHTLYSHNDTTKVHHQHTSPTDPPNAYLRLGVPGRCCRRDSHSRFAHNRYHSNTALRAQRRTPWIWT